MRRRGLTRRRLMPRYSVMSVPGKCEDGADTAWFVTDRCRPASGTTLVGHGDGARLLAFAKVRHLGAAGER